jgi:hypothetical protein
MKMSWSVEQLDKPEDESGHRTLAGKEAKSFWMKPLVIIVVDSYHRNHFGKTAEIFDLGSRLKKGSQLQERTGQHYLRICSIRSGQ